MTKNELKIKTISNKRTDKLTDRVLLIGKVTEKKEKADTSQFLKLLFANPHCTHLVFPRHTKPTLRKTKRAIFCQRTNENKNVNEKT